ncbi:MAG: hypothetical protein ACYCQJ_12805 [Nitrososphaerales archaeon]
MQLGKFQGDSSTMKSKVEQTGIGYLLQIGEKKFFVSRGELRTLRLKITEALKK